MRVVRVRRWIVPGAALSLAAAATATVVVWELADDGGAPRSPRPIVVVARGADAPAPTATDPALAPPSAATPAPAPPAAKSPSPAPPRRPSPATIEPATLAAAGPIEPRPSPIRETPAVRRATPYLGRLVRASSLPDRLDIVQEIARELAPAYAAEVLAGLLDGELPGEFHEAQTLRLGIMAALGQLPAPEAGAALAERLGPRWPRQERLLAIEMLSARGEAPREELLALADDDPDAHVRAKARWALQRNR